MSEKSTYPVLISSVLNYDVQQTGSIGMNIPGQEQIFPKMLFTETSYRAAPENIYFSSGMVSRKQHDSGSSRQQERLNFIPFKIYSSDSTSNNGFMLSGTKKTREICRHPRTYVRRSSKIHPCVRENENTSAIFFVKSRCTRLLEIFTSGCSPAHFQFTAFCSATS
jgi:hypothetical protein